MDHDFEQLEADLSSLKPAPVPAELEATIVAGFSDRAMSAVNAAPAVTEANETTAAENVITGPWSAWQRMGAAAAVLIAGIGVFFAVLNQFGPHSGTSPAPLATGRSNSIAPGTTEAPAPPRPVLVPVSADNVFEGVRDEGIILSSDNIPVRQLRYRFTDSMLLENPEDGSEVQLSMPREHLYLVPVQTD